MVDLVVNVKAPGLSDMVSSSAQVNENLKQAASNSNRISNPVRAAAYSGMGETKTARSIGSGSGTGSSASDFAAQSQGLGGLVHLYATFAANIYAASAAFNALKEAMNTVHLMQGIDQLSAASGKNLASLAGQLNIVTDGALSMKQSLTSVANSSAMGFTNSQILKMGEVAKKASQALGWDMADAMDRLTKGIGKNRPQLLDELGIIINANTVYSDYARSIGKTASTLTDFEKKQSFANAALKQGLDKFSVIDIPTNPFSKLEAAASDAMQSILGLLASGIGPVVKYLSESPSGLMLAMAGIASVLVKQAIPALGAFRENAKKMADESYANLLKSQKDQQKYVQEEDIKLSAAAVNRFQKSKEAEDAIAKMKFTSRTKGSAGIKDLTEKDPFALSNEDIAKMQDTANKMMDSKYKSWNEESVRLQTHINNVTDIRTKADKAGQDASDANERADSSRSSHQSQLQRIVDRQTIETSNRRILSMTAETAATAGPVRAWKELNAAIADSKAGKATIDILNEAGEVIGKKVVPATYELTNGWTRFKGTISIVTSAISTAINAFGIWGEALGAVIAVYEIFDAWASKATEQQSKFNDSIKQGTSAVKVANDSIAFLADKSKNIISLDSVKAMSNAMQGLTDSINIQIESIDDWTKKAGKWDKIKDFVAGIFGKSNAQVLAKSMGEEISTVLKTLVFSPELEKEASQGLSKLLNIKPEDLSNAEDIAAAIDKGMNSSNESVVAQAKSAQAFLNTIKEKDAASTAGAVAFADSLTTVDKEIDTITTKLQFKDGLGKLGLQIEDMGQKMAIAMMNPIKAFDTLLNMAQDPKLLGVLSAFGGTGDNSALISQIASLKALKESTALAVKDISKAQETRTNLINKGNYTDIQANTSIDGVQVSETSSSTSLAGKKADADLAKAKGALDVQMKALIQQEEAIFVPLRDNFTKASTAMIDSQLKYAQGMASLSMATTDLSFAQKAGLVTADRERDIKLQELGYKEKELENSFNLQMAIIDNTIAIEKANALAATTNEALSKPEREKAAQTYTKLSTAEAVHKGQITMGDAASEGAVSTKDIEAINLPYLRAEQGKLAAEAQIGAERYKVLRTAALDKQLQENAVKQASLKIDQDITTQSLAQQTYQERFAGAYSKELSDKRTSLEISQAEQAYQAQELQFVARRNVLNAVVAKDRNDSYNTKIADLVKEEQLAQSKKQLSIDTAKLAQFERQVADALAQQNHEADKRIARAQNYSNLVSAQNDLELTKLGYLKDQGTISENLYNIKSKQIALENLDAQAKLAQAQESKALEDAKSKVQTLETKRTQASDSTIGVSLAAGATPDEATAVGAKAATLAVSNQILQNAKDEVDKQNENIANQQKIRDLAKEKLDAEYAYKDLLKEQADILASMTGLFGDIGTKIFDAGKAMKKFAENSVENTKAISEAKVIANLTGDQSKVQELEKKAAKDKVNGIIEVANQSKKLFGEQTTAYKVLNGIEKAAHAWRIASMVQEGMVKAEETLAAMGITSMADAAAAIGKIPGVLMSFVETMGWPGVAAGAAFVASLGLGGGNKSAPAIDQGTLAGTGQQVGPDGQTIGTRAGGVLGDSKATAKSITDSLDELGKVFFNTMGSSSSNLLTHLKGIQDNTYNTAKALGAAGVMGGTNPFGIATGGGGGGLIDSVMGAIFGSSKTSVTGSGITASGTATGLAQGTAQAQGYTNIHRQSSGFLGFGGSSSDSTQFSQLDNSIQKGIQGIFRNFSETMLDTAGSLGKTKTEIQDILDTTSLSLKVSNVGLTGTEFAQKLSAEVSVQLNTIAEKAYPFLSLYTKVGEESFQVAARLIKDGETVNFGLDMVGKSLKGFSNTAESNVAQQQRVIENFGGTADLFASAIQGYYDALFSDSEKAAFGTTNVQKQLAALGQTGITTNAQLKDLIATIDPTTKLYADLVKLVPAFADANAATQKLTDSIGDQEAAIYNLLGKPTKALEISRAKELAALDATLRPRQVYVNALTDEIALRDKLKAAYNTTNSSLTNSIKTLYDYKNALTAGANSTLTPSEKYAQAKSIFMQTAAAAQAAITANSSAADIAARDAALGKIQSTGDALLGASKEVNASGIQYAADFASVSSTVDKTSEILTGQQTDLQKQVGFLDTIAEATTTTAQLITDYLAARDKTSVAQQSAADAGSTAATVAIPGHARGGLAKGVSLVGENGPEIVDFKNPGRVYSNQASNDLFNTKELVAEIKALRNEVAQLRDDQNKQTGAIINSTFEANAQNAEAITTATQTATSNQDWKTRSQVRVA